MLAFVLVCFMSFLVMSFLVLQSSWRGLVCFCDFRISCYCKCSAALPHGAVGWSAVCDSFHAQLDN